MNQPSHPSARSRTSMFIAVHLLPTPAFSRTILLLLLAGAIVACDRPAARAVDSTQPAPAQHTAPLPVSTDTLTPAVITDSVRVDSDDPAIWVNAANPSESTVLGTDKGDSIGGVYTFRLDGHIDRARSVTPLLRMNNVDVEYAMRFGSVTKDIAIATERLRMSIRVFSMPDMKAIDGGGIKVFDGDTSRAPMGVSIYKRPRDGQVFAIVGGKSGPNDHYLAQYALRAENGRVSAAKVREFGNYSGKKEIESIFVDDELGYVYYSDEGVGVRKYHADPDSGSKELALFATTGFVEDHEGIAMYRKDSASGFLIVSDQGGNRIQVFPREGTPVNAHDHQVLAVIPVRAQQADGLDVTARSMGPAFPRGMLAMMSNRGTFHFYRWEDVEAAIEKVRARGTGPG